MDRFVPVLAARQGVAADARAARPCTGIPFLNRIPMLGLLFGSTEEKVEKTEVVLLITPRVVGPAPDAPRVTDEMRRVTPELEESIYRAPGLPSAPRTH